MSDSVREAFDKYRDERNAALEAEGHKLGSKWHVDSAHYATWQAALSANGGVPDGYTILPQKLTAENGAKALLAGEFFSEIVLDCPDCEGDDCNDCHGERVYTERVPVSWTTIKEIWRKAQALAAPAAPPSVAVPDHLRERVINLLCSLGHQGSDMGDGQMYDVGEWGIREAQELHAMLTAAPAPDHTGDADKMTDEFQRGFEAGKQSVLGGGRELIAALEKRTSDTAGDDGEGV